MKVAVFLSCQAEQFRDAGHELKNREIIFIFKIPKGTYYFQQQPLGAQ